jgi:hypothetical protein
VQRSKSERFDETICVCAHNRLAQHVVEIAAVGGGRVVVLDRHTDLGARAVLDGHSPAWHVATILTNKVSI